MAIGYLHIITSPVKGDIMINNEYRGTGDINVQLEQGSYTISFHPVIGFTTPSTITVDVIPGYTAIVSVTYTK